MARISTYALDAKPSLFDKVIGTEVHGEVGKRTKNYSLREIAELFNESNIIALADQVIFKYQTDLSEGREPGTISLENGGGNNLPFADVVTLMVSVENSGGKDIDDFIKLFNGHEVIIAEAGNVNNFGLYRLVQIEDEVEPGFFRFSFYLFESNGVLVSDLFYVFALFANGDKFEVFEQPNAAIEWIVAHTLDKKPSVTVIDDGENEVVGKVTYIDNDTLKITFNAAFSGKAYLN